MSYVRFLTIALIIVSFLFIMTSCPKPKASDIAGVKSVNTNQPSQTTPDATSQPSDTSADSAQTAEDTASTDTTDTATDESASDASGEQTDSAGGDSSSTDASSDANQDTKTAESDALNPFPPDGTMWSYDDLGKNQNEKVLILCETDKGNILFEIYPELAPNAASAFLELVKAEYFNGTYFHRVIKDFIAQGGSPLNSVELKQYTYNKDNWPVKVKDKVSSEKNVGIIKDEPNFANNDPGTIALAKVGRDKDTYDKDSAGAEFFVNLKSNPDLDKYFTVFGKVVSGMDIVNKLTQDDLIRSMREMH